MHLFTSSIFWNDMPLGVWIMRNSGMDVDMLYSYSCDEGDL